VPDRSPKRLLTPSAERRQSLIDVIAEGVVAGDFPPHLDPELAALAFLGPIVCSRLISGQPFDPRTAADLVDTVLDRWVH
jgi:hypothetical protein